MRDPYRRAGLAGNPFVAAAEPGPPTGIWVDRGLPVRLEFRRATLVQVVGPKGSGKTSHLLCWRRRLPGRYRHVRPRSGRLRPLPVSRVSYWDEADRTSWLVPALAAQSALRHMVVVGTHHDLTVPARRAGLSVITWELPPLTAEVVEAFANLSIRSVGGDPTGWDLPYANVAARAGWSLREAGRLLHIETARRVGVSVSRA